MLRRPGRTSMSTATASLASPMPDRPRSRGPTAATDCLPSTVCLRAARPEGLPPRRTTTRTRHHRRHRHLWQATRRPAAQSSASALAPVWSVISARLPSQRFVLACLSTIYECICTSAPGALCLKSPFSGFFGPSPVFVARYRALPPAYHACPHAIRTSIRFGASMRREKRADRCRTDKNCDDR